MTSRKITARKGISTALLENWSEINLLALPEDKRETYSKRKVAINLYAANESLLEIKKQTGISKQQLYNLIERCTARQDDGTFNGYRGLIPNLRISQPNYTSQDKLTARVPKPGALLALFEKYPQIHERMKKAVLEGKRIGIKLVEKNMPLNVLHQYFIKLCEESGIRGPHYPFNPDSDSEGKPAIRRWISKIRYENSIANLKENWGIDQLEQLDIKDQIYQDRQSIMHCYKRVECDGHKIDIPLVVSYPSPKGEGTVSRVVFRIWVIALVEFKSDAVIGYSLALGKNYSGRDVIRAIENSLIPWSPRKLTVNTTKYRDGDGIPNGVVPELSYVCFDELWFDNFMAQRSDYVVSQIERVVQAVPVYSPVASPNSHPWVEGFFHLLEEAGIHRLPNTSGSSPRDIRRAKFPNSAYYLSYDELADLVDLLVCRINSLDSPGTEQSRIEILRQFAMRRKRFIRRVPFDEREKILEFDIYEVHKIGKDHGRPVIRFEGGRYSNPLLESAPALIGENVLVMAHSLRLRTITATLEDGRPLGKLRCERRWLATEHSLETRRAIKKLEKQGVLSQCDDIVFGFRKYLEIKAKVSQSDARNLLRLNLEQGGTDNGKSALPLEERAALGDLSEQIEDSDLDAETIAATEELLRNISIKYR